MSSVLWIDDQPEDLKPTRDALRSKAVTVELARSWAHAKRKFGNNLSNFDLIVLDMHLPTDGLVGADLEAAGYGDHTGKVLAHLARREAPQANLLFFTQVATEDVRDFASTEHIEVLQKRDTTDEVFADHALRLADEAERVRLGSSARRR